MDDFTWYNKLIWFRLEIRELAVNESAYHHPYTTWEIVTCSLVFSLKFLSSACFIFAETNTYFTSVLVHVSARPFVSAKVIRVRVMYSLYNIHIAGMFVQTSMHAWIKPQLPSVHISCWAVGTGLCPSNLTFTHRKILLLSPSSFLFYTKTNPKITLYSKLELTI